MKEFKVISDSSPIIAHVKKGELPILKYLFKEIVIPKGVYKELNANPEYREGKRKHFQEELKQGWIKFKGLKTLKYPNLPFGKGETEAINASLDVKDGLLLIDKKRAKD